MLLRLAASAVAIAAAAGSGVWMSSPLSASANPRADGNVESATSAPPSRGLPPRRRSWWRMQPWPTSRPPEPARRSPASLRRENEWSQADDGHLPQSERNSGRRRVHIKRNPIQASDAVLWAGRRTSHEQAMNQFVYPNGRYAHDDRPDAVDQQIERAVKLEASWTDGEDNPDRHVEQRNRVAGQSHGDGLIQSDAVGGLGGFRHGGCSLERSNDSGRRSRTVRTIYFPADSRALARRRRATCRRG